MSNIKSLSSFCDFKTLLPNSYHAVSWIGVKGMKYNENIVIDSSGPDANAPTFCKIEVVFLDEKNQLHFPVKSLEKEEFVEKNEWRRLFYESLSCVKTSCIRYNVNGDAFVTWY